MFSYPELTDQASIYQPVFTNLPLEIVALYGSSQKALKNFDQAAKAYEYIISHNHQQFLEILYIWEQAANFYEELGENNKALEIFELLLEDRDKEEIWFRCGVLYKKIGDVQSAIDAFKAILDKNPKMTEAKIFLSNIYMEEGNKKQALRVLEQNFEKNNEQEAVFFSDEDEEDIKLEEETNTLRIKEKISIKSKKIKKKVKFEEDLEEKKSPIVNNEEPLIEEIMKVGHQNFGEKIELSMDLIKKNYDVNDLRLKFIQTEILLQENSTEEFLEKLFDNLILSLKLENEIQVFFLSSL